MAAIEIDLSDDEDSAQDAGYVNAQAAVRESEAAAKRARYLALLQTANEEAVAGSKKPEKPAQNAGKAAWDKYHEDLATYKLEQQANELQRRTLEDTFIAKNDRLEKEAALSHSGMIGEHFKSSNIGSALCSSKNMISELVDWFDGMTSALEGSSTFSVCIRRPTSSIPFGITLDDAMLWSDYVVVSAVSVKPGVAAADPANSPFAKLPLHNPLSASGSLGGSSTAGSGAGAGAGSNAAGSTKNNAFGMLMANSSKVGDKRRLSGGASSSTMTAAGAAAAARFGGAGAGASSSSSSTAAAASSTAAAVAPSWPSLLPGDHIIGINGINLKDHARPVKGDFERFLSAQRQRSASSLLAGSGAGAGAGAGSSVPVGGSGANDFVMSSDSFVTVQSELQSPRCSNEVLLRVRRLTPVGQCFASNFSSGRPPFLFDCPPQQLRSAVVNLLRQETAVLLPRLRKYGLQYLQRLSKAVESSIHQYVAEVYGGRGIDLDRLYGGAASSASSGTGAASSSSSLVASLAPSRSHNNSSKSSVHPIVAAIQKEADRLQTGVAVMPDVGGRIPSESTRPLPLNPASDCCGDLCNGGRTKRMTMMVCAGAPRRTPDPLVCIAHPHCSHIAFLLSLSFSPLHSINQSTAAILRDHYVPGEDEGDDDDDEGIELVDEHIIDRNVGDAIELV